MFTKTVEDRFEIIRDFVSRGSVLDLGCVDSRPARDSAGDRLDRKPNLLLRQIAQINPDTMGVDIDEQGVQILNSMGYNARHGNVETIELGKQFDTIVAGELIEHLENPGLFLRNMHRHLKDEGVLIISTPNPFYQGQTWKIWRYGRPMVHEDHTNWQDPITLGQLFKRTGFELVDGWWVQPRRGGFKTWKRFARPYFAHGFMVAARKARSDAMSL